MVIKLKGVFFTITSATLATLGQIFFHSYGAGADRRLVFLSDWQVFMTMSTCLPSQSFSEMLPTAIWVNVFHTFQRNKPSILTGPQPQLLHIFIQLPLLHFPAAAEFLNTHIQTQTHAPTPSLDSSPDWNVPFLLEVSSVVNLNSADSPSLDQSLAKDLRILLHS